MHIPSLKRLFQAARFLIFQKPKWVIGSRMSRNTFKCDGLMFGCKVSIRGSNNEIIIERGVRLTNIVITISGRNHRLHIKRDTIWGESGRIRIEDMGNSITIGESCDFRGDFFTCSDYNTHITIGDNCMFSSDVVIRTSDSHSIIDENGQRINHGKNVDISSNVWIGNGAVILKGCSLGEYCIVGTNALISNKTVPGRVVVVGNPARIVKTNVTWKKERIAPQNGL